MGLITLNTIDSKEELALAHYRETQRAEESSDSTVTTTPPSASPQPAQESQRDHVGQPLPRGSRLREPQSSGSQSASVTYTVQPGDTLRGIADWFYGDRSRSLALYAANRSTIRDAENLEPGTVLRIPRHGGATPLA
jgi:nucleoid-associated protein YgaU